MKFVYLLFFSCLYMIIASVKVFKNEETFQSLNGQIREYIKTTPIPFIKPVPIYNYKNINSEKYHVISSKPIHQIPIPMQISAPINQFHANTLTNKDATFYNSAKFSHIDKVSKIEHSKNMEGNSFSETSNTNNSTKNNNIIDNNSNKSNYSFHNNTDIIENYEVENCLEYSNKICMRCEKGFYLNFINSKFICVDKCNDNQIANNLLMTCFTKDENNIKNKTSFSYMYSISKCENNCMNEFTECSCKDDCVSKGNCCDDYVDYCLEYSTFISNSTTSFSNSSSMNNRFNIKAKNNKNYRKINNRVINNCELEYKNKSNDFKCSKCLKSTKMFENECVKNCPKDYFNDNFVNVCKKRTSDEVFNLNNTEISLSICNKTNPFYINYKNEKYCMKACPVGYRANKMTLTCEKSNSFTFHWVFPSKGSCNNHCGNLNNIDCSCHFSCMKEGICCDDYEKECTENSLYDNCPKLCDDCSKNGKCLNCKNNSKLIDESCECNDGYEFDLIDNACYKKSSKENDFSSDIKKSNSTEKELSFNNESNKTNISNNEDNINNTTLNKTIHDSESISNSTSNSNLNSTNTTFNSDNQNQTQNSTLENNTKSNDEKKIVIEEAEKVEVTPKKHSKTNQQSSLSTPTSNSTKETSSLEFRKKK